MLAEAEAKAQELGHGDAPRLRLAVGILVGLPWAGDLFGALGRRASPIRLDLVQTGRDTPAQSVHQGRADAAIELGDAAFPGLKRELIAKDELVGIVHRSHVSAARGRMMASEIVNDPYLAHALTPQRGFEFETFFRPARQVPRYIARIESLAAIMALVADGAGVSIQPRSAIVHAVGAGRIVAVPLSPTRIELPWHLHMHPAALALHGEQLMGEIATVLRPHFVAA